MFNSINIGLRALQTQKKSLDVTSHNIANANTEGYTRQRPVQKASDAYTLPGMNMPAGAGQLGTGVEIEKIERIRDNFIDNQIQQKKQLQGEWSKRYDGLHQIESIFNEPSDSSLSSALSKFWQSLEDLSNNPENTAVRTTVKDRALTLVDTFHSLHWQLNDYKESLNDGVVTTVGDINSIINRIADINDQVIKIKGSNQNPNDLLDERDLLFEKLNEKVNVSGRQDARGNLNISLSGINIVTGDDTQELKVVETDEKYENKVVFASTGEDATIASGELKGIMDSRDLDVENYKNYLDDIAAKLVAKFNSIHEDGFNMDKETNTKFFKFMDDSGNQSKQITLNNIIKEDPDKIAASTIEEGVPGNGANALKLARALKQDYTINSKEFSDPTAALNLPDGSNFTINQSENSFKITIENTVEQNDSLEDIAEKINNHDDNENDSGEKLVNALIIDGKLSLESTVTGSGEDISFTNDANGILEGLGLRKITSVKQESLTEPLGYAAEGDVSEFQVTVNGTPETVTVNDDYSLNDVKEAINNASIGVKASIEDDALLIESVNVDNAISDITDDVGTVVEDLAINDGDIKYIQNKTGSNSSLMTDYQSMISTVGVEGQRAKQMADNQDVLVDQLSNQRQSISGVSLDEEMTNMLKYQQAYAAASKIITTTNQMLDTLMGIIR